MNKRFISMKGKKQRCHWTLHILVLVLVLQVSKWVLNTTTGKLFQNSMLPYDNRPKLNYSANQAGSTLQLKNATTFHNKILKEILLLVRFFEWTLRIMFSFFIDAVSAVAVKSFGGAGYDPN